MALTLLVWIYITLNCFAWGSLVIALIDRHFPSATTVQPAFPMICFTGLVVIGTVALGMSIFMPLGWLSHSIVLLVSISWFLFKKNRSRLFQYISIFKEALSWPAGLLLASCCIMVLLINTYEIKHPDTLGYHAQAIHWLERYKAVPGIVHIDHEMAMPSLWFAVQAIFRFDFLYPNHYLFVNGCVLCWFFLFIAGGGHEIFAPQQTIANNRRQVISWLILLAFTLLSWTQVRLTAASASPDFIAALCIWAAFYSCRQAWKQASPFNVHLFLTALFACAAITTKLSAIPVLLLPLIIIGYCIFRKRLAVATLLALGLFLCLLPYCIRNVITSGYPFFPVAVLDIFPVDWKISLPDLKHFQYYITSYARDPNSMLTPEEMVQLSFSRWIPTWWNNLVWIDQLLMGITGILLLFNLATIKKQVGLLNFPGSLLLLVSLTGSIVWLLGAPALRFGTGFIIPLLYSLYIGLGKYGRLPETLANIQWYKIISIPITTIVLLYSGYRVVHFFVPSQVVVPVGVQRIAYTTITCEGNILYLTQGGDLCGFIPIPCVQDSCRSFMLRSKDIRSGFKKRE